MPGVKHVVAVPSFGFLRQSVTAFGVRVWWDPKGHRCLATVAWLWRFGWPPRGQPCVQKCLKLTVRSLLCVVMALAFSFVGHLARHATSELIRALLVAGGRRSNGGWTNMVFRRRRGGGGEPTRERRQRFDGSHARSLRSLYCVRMLSSSQSLGEVVHACGQRREPIWTTDASDILNQRKLFTSQPA